MLRVVVADDEPLVRRGIRSALESSGGLAELVGEASTGEQAVARVRELKPDLILLDIRMPGGDGISAAEQIRKLSPSTRIVVLTAYPDFTYAQKMLRLGASDYLLKPSSPHALLEVMRSIARDVRSFGRTCYPATIYESTPPASTSGSPLKAGADGEGGLTRRGAIAAARRYIDENLYRPLTLSEVADFVGFSPWYFSAIFRTEVGCPFRDYLSRVRVEAGKRALVETGLSIQEIAYRVGYSEPSHFTQAFKRIVGVTPRQYLKREAHL